MASFVLTIIRNVAVTGLRSGPAGMLQSEYSRGVAQWLARHVRDVEVGGSNPLTPTIIFARTGGTRWRAAVSGPGAWKTGSRRRRTTLRWPSGYTADMGHRFRRRRLPPTPISTSASRVSRRTRWSPSFAVWTTTTGPRTPMGAASATASAGSTANFPTRRT